MHISLNTKACQWTKSPTRLCGTRFGRYQRRSRGEHAVDNTAYTRGELTKYNSKFHLKVWHTYISQECKKKKKMFIKVEPGNNRPFHYCDIMYRCLILAVLYSQSCYTEYYYRLP